MLDIAKEKLIKFFDIKKITRLEEAVDYANKDNLAIRERYVEFLQHNYNKLAYSKYVYSMVVTKHNIIVNDAYVYKHKDEKFKDLIDVDMENDELRKDCENMEQNNIPSTGNEDIPYVIEELLSIKYVEISLISSIVALKDVLENTDFKLPWYLKISVVMKIMWFTIAINALEFIIGLFL